MQSTFSVAAMIVAILGVGEVKTPIDGGEIRVLGTDVAYMAGWSAPDRPWKSAFFGMPRPRLPRSGW
jgi:hypothetical protein